MENEDSPDPWASMASPKYVHSDSKVGHERISLSDVGQGIPLPVMRAREGCGPGYDLPSDVGQGRTSPVRKH